MKLAIKDSLKRLAFSEKTRIDFYKLMYSFSNDGIPVYEALTDLINESKYVSVVPNHVLESLMGAMRGIGSSKVLTIGEALSKWVDPIESALIESGERSGDVAIGFREASLLLETRARIRKKLRSELLSPVGLVGMLFVLLWVVSTQMVPVMDDVLPRAKWPGYAQAMGWIADHVGSISVVLLVGLGTFITAFVVSAKNWIGNSREFFDRYVAPWSTYRVLQATMILNSIAMMIGAGVPIADSIKQLSVIGTKWQVDHYGRMQARLRHGASEAESIVGKRGEVGLFDTRTAYMVRMYGGRTNLAESMKSLAREVLVLLEERLAKQFGLMRTILMFFVAGMAIFAYLSFMSVTFTLTSGVGRP